MMRSQSVGRLFVGFFVFILLLRVVLFNFDLNDLHGTVARPRPYNQQFQFFFFIARSDLSFVFNFKLLVAVNYLNFTRTTTTKAKNNHQKRYKNVLVFEFVVSKFTRNTVNNSQQSTTIMTICSDNSTRIRSDIKKPPK